MFSRSLFPVLGLLLLAAPLPAQNAPQQAPEIAEFWLATKRAQAGATAQLVAIGDPFTLLAMRYCGEKKLVWGWEMEALPERAPPLPPELLAGITDKAPFADMANRPPDEIPVKDWIEYHAYCKALFFAWKTPLEAFEKSAFENEDVTWGHMWGKPLRYRGEVVPIHGTLKRLRKFDSPWDARIMGVPHIYEGWVYSETPKSNPSCVVFAYLPEGVKTGEKVNYKIQSAGYFLKRYRYQSGKGPLETLFFIAPTFKAENLGPTKAIDVSIPMVVFIVAGSVIIGAFCLVFLLTLFMRRGDSKVKKRLEAAKARLAAPPGLEDEPLLESGTPVSGPASNGENIKSAEGPPPMEPYFPRDVPPEGFRR